MFHGDVLVMYLGHHQRALHFVAPPQVDVAVAHHFNDREALVLERFLDHLLSAASGGDRFAGDERSLAPAVSSCAR